METSVARSASLAAGDRLVEPSRASTAFALTMILLIIVLVYSTRRVACSTCSQVNGYWASAGGDLFEVSARTAPAAGPEGPQQSGYAVATASGLLGASPTEVYPLTATGCREVSILFPRGTLQGSVDLGRRRISWGNSPTWYRQRL
jgi:hypothetical protein